MEKKPFKVRLAAYILVLLVVVLVIGKLQVFSHILRSQTFKFNFLDTGLSGIVNSQIAGHSGEYAIYIESLTSGERYGLNDKDVFPAASLYKLFLMAAVLEAIDAGQLTLDIGLTAQKSYLSQKFGGTDFGYEEAPETISYSVDEALQRVGRISDNFAAIMLADRVGWDKVQEMANKLGAVNTTIKDPFSTSVSDIGLFFKKLYLGEVVSKDVSGKIADYLSLSKISDRIPAQLPQGIKVVHKTGELRGVRNDAGIVYLQSETPGVSEKVTPGVARAYVIVLMAKDVTFEDDAVALEADLSQGVYEYFSSK